MPFNAHVYRIFIASPSDVVEERNAVREIVEEWNVVHASSRRIVILPIGWETHAVPEMGVRPQDHINDTVLKDCDVLVGIFWSRMGSHAGQGMTGTEEEIECHIEAGKPARLYFAEKPLPNNIDTVQVDAVRAFRQRIERERKGLFGCFQSAQQFKDLFRKHLGIMMNSIASENFIAESQPPLQQGRTHESPGTELSGTASYLLKMVSSSDEAFLLVKPHYLMTPGAVWNTTRDGRLRAELMDALEELKNEGCLRDETGLGERYIVTNLGFQKAESLPSLEEYKSAAANRQNT